MLNSDSVRKGLLLGLTAVSAIAVLGTMPTPYPVEQSIAVANTLQTPDSVERSNVPSMFMNSLPPNTQWDKGCAPAARFQSLKTYLLTAEQMTKKAIKKDSVTEEEQDTVNLTLNIIQGEIETSLPGFPNADLVALSQGYIKPQWVTNVTHSLAEQKGIEQSFTSLKSKLNTLQNLVETSLNTQGPAVQEEYGTTTYDKAIQSKFSEAKNSLYDLINKAGAINETGFTVTHNEEHAAPPPAVVVPPSQKSTAGENIKTAGDAVLRGTANIPSIIYQLNHKGKGK